MFKKGLIHKVDIKPIERKTSNRLNKNQMRNKETTMKDVECRVIKDEKIMFNPDIKLKTGDLIVFKAANKDFTVTDEYIATGFNIHHRTYGVERKRI